MLIILLLGNYRYVKPWRDYSSGKSYCLFFPYSPEHLAQSVPKSNDMRPYISLSISASLQETNHVSGSASALFVGGFSVLEMGKVRSYVLENGGVYDGPYNNDSLELSS